MAVVIREATMKTKTIDPGLSVSAQIQPEDVPALAAAGFRAILCNRPDHEAADQVSYEVIAAAARDAGLAVAYQPVVSGQIAPSDVTEFDASVRELPAPLLAYCRTGTRSTTLWALSQAAKGKPMTEIVDTARAAGYDVEKALKGAAQPSPAPTGAPDASHTVVIVGGGTAGGAAAASLKARQPDLDIAIIDPAEEHYYQPGWTLVGAGVFEPETTVHTMASSIPKGVAWIKAAVAGFAPDDNLVKLTDGRTIRYERLVVAPGLKLNWAGIEGLTDTIGRHGVTSNYRYDLAPYTWELVQKLKSGRAVFTQPPMPIKCAGAPQKALYLSADHWLRHGQLKDIAIDFYNAGPVLFGVKEYVPPLQKYIDRYDANLHFGHTLTRIDGPARRAWFSHTAEDGTKGEVETSFDMIHVVPPQVPHDFMKGSQLGDAAGWVEVDQATLRHKRYANVYGLGDACSAPNAKTVAAARKQAPVVAHNIVRDLTGGREPEAVYDGYGSCPLTVERGKIVLAEFGYGGKLLPSFPSWLIDSTKPSRLAWFLKERLLPPIYWQGMLKGREWMAKPHMADKPTA